ncbi:hypothetical protein AT4G09355, partial [Arabidopsis thaliana]
LLTEALSA